MKKIPDRSSFGGKQLANAPPKDGKTVDVYFEKKHNWIADVSLFMRPLIASWSCPHCGAFMWACSGGQVH